MKYSYWDNRLTVNDIDVEAAVRKVQKLLAQEQNVPPALRSALDELLLVVQLLVNRLGRISYGTRTPIGSKVFTILPV